ICSDWRRDEPDAEAYQGGERTFEEWRFLIARLARIAGPDRPVTDDMLWGRWPDTPPEPLDVLMCHADHYGTILPRDCGPIADRLEELLPRIPAGLDPDMREI